MNSILITGGTGTVGQAVAKSALEKGFNRVCIFSRDEYKQSLMADEFKDARMRYFLGDVRDKERLRRALEGIDCVVHAAALKRVEAGEFNPGEFKRTNIDGTQNLIEAAHDAGVKRVVGISTDKALRPQSAYGASKLMMEKLLLAANNARGEFGPMYSVTRFGNVAGSRGSVIEIWRNLIRQGVKSLPVTDARCTRYWLSTEDICQIVWDALAIMPIQPLMPKARSYLITDLAEAMGMPWHVIGLRDGESLHESMSDEDSSETAPRLSVGELIELIENHCPAGH